MAKDEFRPDAAGLARVLGSIPGHVLVMDGEGRIVYLNRARGQYAPEEFIGTLGTELMPPDSQAVFTRALASVTDTGEPQVYDAFVVLPDGTGSWYRTRMSPFGEEGGRPHVLLVSHDVTAEKEAEAEAARLRKLLPMCAWCLRIRDEQGGWSRIETYLAARDDTAITHAICPRCEEEQMSEGGDQSATGGSAA